MPKFQIKSVIGGISEYFGTGIFGSHKLLQGLDVRKKVDSLSCQQALVDEGLYDGATVQVSQTTEDTDEILRSGATTNVKLAQSFQPTTGQKLFKVQLKIKKGGSPVGNVYATIEANVAGAPSGIPLATSDNVDASTVSGTAGFVDFVFSTKPTLANGTTYWIVLQGTYTVSGVNYILWRSNSTSVYASGAYSAFNATSWATATKDFAFKTYYARSIFTDLLLHRVYSSDGNTYYGGDAGNIYKRTPAGVWTIVKVDADGKIRGMREWMFAGGQVAIFWATATKLHAKLIPGSADWSDADATITVSAVPYTYPKSNLTDVEFHTMEIANGVLMIANGQWVAIVGFDGSYTNQSLRLRPDDLAKAIIDRADQGIIGTYPNSAKQVGTIYSWQTDAQNYINRKQIATRGVNAIIDTEVGLMQAGVDGGIYYSDFVNFLPLHRFPGGGQVTPDGVEVSNGMALFGVYGGDDEEGNVVSGIYTLGRQEKNGPFVLNLDYPWTCDKIGMVANTGDDILFSYKLGANYGVAKVDDSNKAIANFFSLELSVPEDTFESPVHFSLASFKTKVMPAGTKIEFYFRIDKEDAFVQAETADGEMQYEVGVDDGALKRKKAVFLIGGHGLIIEALIVLYPLGNVTPEVFFPIEIHFET